MEYGTVIKSEKREMVMIRRYRVKSFTDLCFCDLGKLTMRKNGRTKSMGLYAFACVAYFLPLSHYSVLTLLLNSIVIRVSP